MRSLNVILKQGQCPRRLYGVWSAEVYFLWRFLFLGGWSGKEVTRIGVIFALAYLSDWKTLNSCPIQDPVTVSLGDSWMASWEHHIIDNGCKDSDLCVRDGANIRQCWMCCLVCGQSEYCTALWPRAMICPLPGGLTGFPNLIKWCTGGFISVRRFCCCCDSIPKVGTAEL